MWTEAFDRLWEAHFLENVGLPGIGDARAHGRFGLFNIGGSCWAIAVAAPLGKRLEHSGQAGPRVLFWLDAFLLVSALLFALAGSLWLAVSGSG